jgi:hypothetical protein
MFFPLLGQVLMADVFVPLFLDATLLDEFGEFSCINSQLTEFPICKVKVQSTDLEWSKLREPVAISFSSLSISTLRISSYRFSKSFAGSPDLRRAV